MKKKLEFKTGDRVIIQGVVAGSRINSLNDSEELNVIVKNKDGQTSDHFVIWADAVHKERGDTALDRELIPPFIDPYILEYLNDDSEQLMKYLGAAMICINRNIIDFSEDAITQSLNYIDDIEQGFEKGYTKKEAKKWLAEIYKSIHKLYTKEQIEDNKHLKALNMYVSKMMNESNYEPYMITVVEDLLSSVQRGGVE